MLKEGHFFLLIRAISGYCTNPLFKYLGQEVDAGVAPGTPPPPHIKHLLFGSLPCPADKQQLLLDFEFSTAFAFGGQANADDRRKPEEH